MSTTDKNHYIDDRDRARYSNNRPAAWERDNRSFSQRNTDSYRDKDPKTFNEDKESWDKRNDKPTENNGTGGNDWNANDPIERSTDYRYDDEDRDAAFYIDSDHSNYNRGNDRYRWSTEDWD